MEKETSEADAILQVSQWRNGMTSRQIEEVVYRTQ